MAKPKRLDAYIRVSRVGGREGDSFQSPAQQRSAIEQWAKLRGVEIASWWTDLDQTGGKLSRPEFDKALARVRAGETGGVVVSKLNRFSRAGVADALKLIEEIYAAGGEIASVEEGLDPTTAAGKFGMTLFLALGEMQRTQIGDAWRTAQANAVERGAHVGHVPLGYRKAKGQALEPNEDAAKVKLVFKAAADEGLDAARNLMRDFWPEREWNRAAAATFLANVAYLGRVELGEFVNETAHPALVDEATFALAQVPGTNGKTASADFPLSGVAVCAACGGPLVGSRGGRDQHRRYRCNANERKGGSCPEPLSVNAERLEALVAERAVKLQPAVDIEEAEAEVEAAESAREKAQRALTDYATNVEIQQAAGAAAYAAGLAKRREAFDTARKTEQAAYGQLAAAYPDIDAGQYAAVGRVVVERGPSDLSDRISVEPR